MPTLFDLLKKHEGAGNPDTLFGHSQRPGGAFEGVKLSSMPVGEVANKFGAVDGAYGQWVKSQVGRVATPMGIPQIVGTTLRSAMADLKIDPNRKFDEGLQTELTNYLAKKRILAGKGDPAAIRRGLRQEWEGFKHVSDRDLDVAAAQLMGAPTQARADAENPDTPVEGLDAASAAERGDGDLRSYSRSSSARSAALYGLAGGFTMKAADPTDGINLPITPGDARAGMPGAPQLGMPAGIPTGMPPGMFPPSGKELSFGGGSYAPTAVPAANETGIAPAGFGITPSGAGAATVATSGEEPDMAVPEGEGPPEQEGFMEKIAKFLYPKSEAPGENLNNLIGGLGVGLGQMSAGQPVNLESYFAGIAERKQAAYDGQIEARQSMIDNEFQARELAIKSGNLGVAEERLALDQLNAEYDKTNEAAIPFSPEQLEKYRANPKTAPFVEFLQSPDPKTRQEGMTQIAGVISDSMDLEDPTGNMADAYNALSGNWRPGEPLPPEAIPLLNQLEGPDFARVVDALDLSRTAPEKITDAIANAEGLDPVAKANLLREVTKNSAGISDNFIATENFTFGAKRIGELTTKSRASSDTLPIIYTMRQATDEILQSESGKDTSILTSILADTQTALAALGFDDAAGKMAEYTGASVEQIQALSQAEKALLFTIGRQAFSGQGSVSDTERQSLAASIVSSKMSSSSRIDALAKLEAMAVIDQISAPTFSTMAGSNMENAYNADMFLTTDVAPMLGTMTSSFTALNRYQRAKFLDDPAKEKIARQSLEKNEDGSFTPEALKARATIQNAVAPVLSQKQALFAASAFKERGITHYKNKDGQLVKFP